MLGQSARKELSVSHSGQSVNQVVRSISQSFRSQSVRSVSQEVRSISQGLVRWSVSTGAVRENPQGVGFFSQLASDGNSE